MSPRSRAVTTAVLASAACIACGVPPEPLVPAEPPVLRIATRAPLPSLDPRELHGTGTLGVLSNVYETLVELDRDLSIRPLLATSWSNPNDLTWTFRLRAGVVFHDGQRFGARDVAYTLERAMESEDSFATARLPKIAHVVAPGDDTVVITTTSPAPMLLSQLSQLMIVPRNAGERLALEAVGTGRYAVARFDPEGEVELRPFDAYWGQRPTWSRAIFRSVPDAGERIERVLRGETDLAESPLLEDLERVRSAGGAQVLDHPGLAVTLLGFNVEPGPGNPFADPLVRQAVSRAVDRTGLVREALLGHGHPASQLAPPGAFGFAPHLTAPGADAKLAAAALAASGFAGGVHSTLEFRARDAPVARFAAAAAAAIGVRFDLEEMEWGPFGGRLNARAAPAFIWRADFPNADAGDLLLSSLHTRDDDARLGLLNYAGYSDPRLDELLEASARELDPARRAGLLHAAMEAAVGAEVLLPLCVPAQLYVARNSLRWAGHPAGRIDLDSITDTRSARP